MNKKEKKKLIKLEQMRLKNSYTHLEMANLLGISKAYYWQIENGNRNLYYEMARKIAAIFKMKPDEVFYEDLK